MKNLPPGLFLFNGLLQYNCFFRKRQRDYNAAVKILPRFFRKAF